MHGLLMKSGLLPARWDCFRARMVRPSSHEVRLKRWSPPHWEQPKICSGLTCWKVSPSSVSCCTIIFPPFSVGEVGFLRGPGRREIGHGNLAERALAAVIPAEEKFPYTIRVVSDILEST